MCTRAAIPLTVRTGSLFASILPLALGVAFSPLGIIAIIVVLFTSRPVRNGIAFDLGWLLAIAVIFAVTYLIAAQATVDRPSEPPRWAAAVHLAVGVVLVMAAAWMLWRGHDRVRRAALVHRPREVIDASPQLPNWMKSIPAYRAPRCLLLGFVLCAVNPVDASCIIAAAVDVRVSDVSGAATAVAVALFVIIGMCTVVGLVAYVAVQVMLRRPCWSRCVPGSRSTTGSSVPASSP